MEVEQLCAELQAILRKRANIVSGQISAPINVAMQIRTVPLVIGHTVNDENLDDVEQFTRRNDFIKFYKRVHTSLQLHELFSEAWKQAEFEANNTCTNPQAKEEYISIHGNIVGVVGQAGIGKTTLSRTLTSQILNKVYASDMKYIFYIAFREIDYTQKISFLHFLLSGNSYQWSHSNACDKMLLNHISNCPDVILIMDGLDEAVLESPEKKMPNILLSEKEKPEAFIKYLLCGKLFPRAKKILTSRPRQLFKLNPYYMPHFIVSILGLGETSQKLLCQQICGSDFDRVNQYLNNNPDIRAYCYVPVNCILTMSALAKQLINDVNNSISLTCILVYCVNGLLRSEHARNLDKSELCKLARLAWNGFCNRKTIFSEDDLKSVNISNDTIHSFLSTWIDFKVGLRLLEGDKKTYFSHQIWQEFFVAVELMFFMPLEEFLVVILNLNEPRYEVVIKFMFGLSNENAFIHLKRIVTPAEGYEEKVMLLKRFASSSIPVSFNKRRSTVELLKICSWLKEANREDFNADVCFPSRIKLLGKLLPSDIASLHYYLRSSSQSYIIEVGISIYKGVLFIGDSFHRMFYEMEITTRRSNIKLEKIFLSGNIISDQDMEAMSKCIKDVECLELYGCVVSPNQIEILANAISRKLKPLSWCSLNESKLLDRGISIFSSCLHKVRTLYVWNCGFTEVGMSALAEAIEHLPHKLEDLDLRENTIGNVGVSVLARSFRNIRKVDISLCGITEEGIERLSEEMQHLQEPIQEINLRQNKVGDVGASAVARSLRNVKVLDISSCGITEAGRMCLLQAVDRLQTSGIQHKPILKL